MDPRKIWVCKECGHRMDDYESVVTGCQVCAQRNYIRKWEETHRKDEPCELRRHSSVDQQKV
jgi:predicted  nucleic acid-binding Zn-ribbon protein